ncbi:chitinase domain-containing protein 1-like isoform X2 [Centruroides sculpturatus]|uniref:chitinase domain-containing protein 1-like isoform X2 n=2 Tax=Centruroides sculpturatus TaxID=218467 RepID=UPI000C6D854E|nr:chitinase domain-containing protein 1-like isoform X2 [Centruroides sculpturatus]XP_023230755.1 chitinase domain-containing protein 1-like isoform X2 [Centruroides sculpturatus]
MNYIQIFILLLSIECIFSTISKSSRDERAKTSSKISNFNDLISENPKYKDIIQEHESFSLAQTGIRNFNNIVLGYVTPWNNHGYDIAKIFGSKFTMISPVWLQLKPKLSNSFAIEGKHDIDKKWIIDVKRSNKIVSVVPRLMFEEWSYDSVMNLIENSNFLNEICVELIDLAKKNNFDGYVLELWNILSGKLKIKLINVIQNIANKFQENKLHVILVIPPPIYSNGMMSSIHKEDIKTLSPYITAFSLMTYDYSSIERPGPNSPLQWIQECMNVLLSDAEQTFKNKILLGLNFYGNDYKNGGGGPIIGNQYISMLTKYKPKIKWDKKHGEHYFNYKTDFGSGTVYYPSLQSIKLRLQLAEEFGIGVAIWEIGQGLDYFYNLF